MGVLMSAVRGRGRGLNVLAFLVASFLGGQELVAQRWSLPRKRVRRG